MREGSTKDKVSVGRSRRIVVVLCAILMATCTISLLPENVKAQAPVLNPTWTSIDLGPRIASLDMANDMSDDNERYIAAGTYHSRLYMFRASGGGIDDWNVSVNVAGGRGRATGYYEYLTDSVSISTEPHVAVGNGRYVSLYDVNGNQDWRTQCIPSDQNDPRGWETEVRGTAIDDDSTRVAAGGANTVCLFNVATGAVLSTASTNLSTENIVYVDMSQDTEYVAVGTVTPQYQGAALMVFHNNAGTLNLVMRSMVSDNLVLLDMSDDGAYIVVGEGDEANRPPGTSDARLYHWGADSAWDWSDGLAGSFQTSTRNNDVYSVAMAHQGTYSSVGGTWANQNATIFNQTFGIEREWYEGVHFSTAMVDHPLGVYAVFGQGFAATQRTVFFCRADSANCTWQYTSTDWIDDVDAEGYFHVVAGTDDGYVHYWRDNPPPVAGFTWDPEFPDEGEDVDFTDLSYDPDGRIVNWSWDFGGLGSSYQQNPTFVFGHGGTYPVTLNVTDDEGATDEITRNITIANVSPTVTMWSNVSQAYEGQNLTFDGYFDDPSWLDNHTATWDFGDGTPTVPGTFSPGWGYTHHDMDEVVHAYGKAGIYQVTLTVQDDMGGVGSHSVNVTILNVAPTVNASISQAVVQEGGYFTVNGSFYDPSWNDTFDEVYFDFGYEDTMRGLGPIQDRGYSPPPGPGNVTHSVDPMDWIYGDDGNYTIYLNVTDEFGGFGSDSVYTVVQNVPPTVSNVTVILHQNAPRTHGYWKHQCKISAPKKDHPGIRQEWIDAIRNQSQVFNSVFTKNDVCGYLDPTNPMTPMKRAKMQLMALWLNVVSGLLFFESPLNHPLAPANDSVAEFMVHAEFLILTSPTDPNLNWVATIACDINEDASGGNDWQHIDPMVGEHYARAYDPGTDDLMFVWEDGLLATGNIIHYHYNDGMGPEPTYSAFTNDVKTPWGTYPFVVIDRLIVGYPPNYASGTTGELLCLKDDDGGVSMQANKDCSDPWGSGMSMMRLGENESVDWSFEFMIDYRVITDGFIIAEVEAFFTNTHPLVEPLILGGWIEEE